MEKAINTKTKKVNVIYGFFSDINYGVDYPTLIDNIDMIDLFPYINKGEVEITKNGLSSVLFSACSELKGSAWENRENPKYKLFMEVRTLKYEPTIDVCFHIVENTIKPLNTNVTREQAVAEAGEKSIKELENYWGF